jgi:alkylresorcinol/alkylpyrone synthase
MTLFHLDRAQAMPVSLVGIGTAVPPHVLHQDAVAELAREVFADRYPDYDRLAPVFKTSGIQTRYAVQPLDWYRTQRGWPERTGAYLDGVVALFEEAAGHALTCAGLAAADIDAIVTVSSTGIATPSLDVRAFGRMGFRPGTRRIPVFGLGCAGGVSGLSIAADIARGRPGRNVLMVAAEACSLAFRLDELTKSNIVATALFGDGAAACILRADARPLSGAPVITHTAEYAWPDTLDLMGWNVDPDGFGVIFARSIPAFARTNIGDAVTTMLAQADLKPDQIARFICHPGGARVVDVLEQALNLDSGSLAHERAILADYGNMSAPTVLFVLKRVMAEGLPLRTALLAMGPGFTTSCAVLEQAA